MKPRLGWGRSVAIGIMAGLVLLGRTYAVEAAVEEKPFEVLPPGAVAPVAIRQRMPVYPDYLASAGVTGEVTVEFIVNTEGNVINPVVVATNNPWFERPALNAILKWKFKPGEVGGRKVNVRYRQILEFIIDRRTDTALWRPPEPKGLEELPEQYRWAKAPEPVRTAFPVYPFAALRAGLKGKVRVNFIVGPSGRVVSAKVSENTTPEFGDAMLAMLDTWAFTAPTKKNGTPCFAAVAIQMSFLPDGFGDAPVTHESMWILRWLEKTPEKIHELSALDHMPKSLSQRPPVYPSSLLTSGKKGEALVDFFIDEEGGVQLPSIVSSSAKEFGYAAVQAIATWRFEPPVKAGKAVVAHAQIPVMFVPP